MTSLANHHDQALIRFLGILLIWSWNLSHIKAVYSRIGPDESSLNAGLQGLNADLLEVNDL